MKCYGMLLFFNKHFFLVPDRSLKGYVLCSRQDEDTHEIIADLQYEHQQERSDHSSPQLILCGFC